MKANITNLRKALKASAKAHNVEFGNWSNEGHFSLGSDAVPVVSDVSMIAEAFFGTSDIVETDWGYTIMWLSVEFLPEVNESLLALALPAGTEIN